jgi:hypothetical protein
MLLLLLLLLSLALAAPACQLSCTGKPASADEVCFRDRLVPASREALHSQIIRILKMVIHTPLRPHELENTIRMGRMFQYYRTLLQPGEPDWEDVFMLSYLERAASLANKYAKCM